MEKFVFIPLESIGGIRFSAKREDVRKEFGKYTEFKKNKFSKNTTDDFGFCHVFYDSDDLCEAVEFFNDVAIIYDESNISNSSYGDIKNFLSEKDSALEIDDDGIVSKNCGISVYAPDKTVESILVFRKGYYD